MNLLALSLVAGLVTTARSLICQCTEGPGCSSQGTCSVSDSGVCMLMAQENNAGGAKTSGLYKSCQWSAQPCSQKVMTVTSVKGMYWTSNTKCCTGNNCNAASINVPPVSRTPNGLECPACFAFGSSSDCEEDDMLTCTGTQDHCITISGMMDRERGLSSPFIAKGCCTGMACFLPLGVDLYTPGITLNFNNITCNPSPAATADSRAD